MSRPAMKIIQQAAELQPGARKVCAAIGVFDGVHLGHQQVIRQTVADAEQQEALAVVITFDRHPNSVVAPARTPLLIYSLPQKLRAIAALGADATLVIPFDQAFSERTAEEFISGLGHDFGKIHSLCVGSDFTFGHKRGGNVALLKTLGAKFRFTVHGLGAVALDNEPVSSTRIREAVRAGRLDRAGELLGREYALAGLIERGDQLGRQLGFPTANLDVTGRLTPPVGVYAVHAYCGGQRHRAVLNIGHRPTVKTPAPVLRVEAHLLDFSGDLYGQELEITFVEKLRDEVRQVAVHISTDAVHLSSIGVECHTGKAAGAHARSPDDHPGRHVAAVVDVPDADEARLQELRHAATRARRILGEVTQLVQVRFVVQVGGLLGRRLLGTESLDRQVDLAALGINRHLPEPSDRSGQGTGDSPP